MPPLVAHEDMDQIAGGIDHAEGICMTPDGTVYVSGEKGQIYRIEDDDSANEVATTKGWTLGLAADGAGRIYACDPVNAAVFRWAPGGGDPEVWTNGTEDAPMAVPNWGAFGPDGTYYVSDSGGWKERQGRIYTVRDGRTEVWTTASLDFPNGLAVTPDGSELWVLESTPGKLVAYDIGADGSAGERRELLDLAGHVPDGIAFAADGSVIIPCYRPDIILRWQPGSEVQTVGEDPEGTVIAAPTNAAFIGPDLDIVAVPNLGRWHVTRFRIPGVTGVPLFYPDDAALGAGAPSE